MDGLIFPKDSDTTLVASLSTLLVPRFLNFFYVHNLKSCLLLSFPHHHVKKSMCFVLQVQIKPRDNIEK